MDHRNYIDLTCSDSPGGASTRRRFKNSRSKVRPSCPSSTFRSQREDSSSSSVVSSQGPLNVSQGASTSSASSSSASSTYAHPQRFVGDGLDFRQPANYSAMAPQPSNLIDLTLSDEGEDDDLRINLDEDEDEDESDDDDVQIIEFPSTVSPTDLILRSQQQLRQSRSQQRPNRGPRFPRSIMNEATDSEEPTIGSRRSTRRHDHSNPSLQHPRTLPPLPRVPVPQRPVAPEVIDITDDAEDSTQQQQQQQQQQQLPAFRQTYYPAPARAPTVPSHFSHAIAVWRTVRNHAPTSLNFLNPSMMDYTRTAFSMGSFGTDPPAAQPPANTPPSPTLEPLPPPPSGFTRSPREGDVLVCPLCQEELCMGEAEGKGQVWVVKACGHVYCGTCAAKRPRSRPKKQKGTQFTSCVVPSCTEKVTGAKSMYQLFL